MSDLLRRKTGDGLLSAGEGQRRQLLVRQVLSAELRVCQSITRAALPSPIPSDVLVGRALPPGKAEDSVTESGASAIPSSPRSPAVELAAVLTGEVVLHSRWCTTGPLPDMPTVTERAIVWPRGVSLSLPMEIHRQFKGVCWSGQGRPAVELDVDSAAIGPSLLHPSSRPNFLGVQPAVAGSPFGSVASQRYVRWSEVFCQVLPLRLLPGSHPGLPCGSDVVVKEELDSALEAGARALHHRSLSEIDVSVRFNVERLAQSTPIAFWDAEAVSQAQNLVNGSATGVDAYACATLPLQHVDPPAVREEHQPIAGAAALMDCPVLRPYVKPSDLAFPVAEWGSLPSSQAVACAALDGLAAAGLGAGGAWALRLFDDCSVLPWRWHWDRSSALIETPPAWTMNKATNRALKVSIFTAAEGLVPPRALSDVRRHVDSFWRACPTERGQFHQSSVAALGLFVRTLLATSASGRHPHANGLPLADHAADLEDVICSYILLDQPDHVMAGPVEPRRPGRLRQRASSAAPSRGSRASPGSASVLLECPMVSLHAVPTGNSALNVALGEPTDAKLPTQRERLASSSPVTTCVLSRQGLLPGHDVAFSEADSSSVVRAKRSSSGDPTVPLSRTPSGSGSGHGSRSAELDDMGGAPASLDGLVGRKLRPRRVLRKPQRLNVVQSQQDMAELLLGRSTVLMLPPPAQPLSLTCLLAETYLRTSGYDHRCLWLSSASTANLTNAFKMHQLALSEHHLVLLDAEPRASSRSAAATARFVFASVSAARALLADDSLFSFVIFDCGASVFQAQELSDLVAQRPLLRLVPSSSVLLVEDAVSSLGVAVRDVQHNCAMATQAHCGATSVLLRHSADRDVQDIVQASSNVYVESSAPVASTLRLLDAAAGPLIRPLWLRHHPTLRVAGSLVENASLLPSPTADVAPLLRDLVADKLFGAVIQMQDVFAAAHGPVQTTLVGRGSLSDLKALTTLHVLRCARDHALLHGVDTCASFLAEAQAHYEGQVQNLRPWCQRLEEEVWDSGAGQPSVAAALQQIIAVEPGGSVLIVAASRDLATISSALPAVRRLNDVGLAESPSPQLTSSESSAVDVLVADYDDLAAASDALYTRLALVLLVSTSPPVALLQFLNAGAVRCRFIRMSEAAAAAEQEEKRLASLFDATVLRCRQAADPSVAVVAGLLPLSSIHESPPSSVIRLPSRFCENHTPSQLAILLTSQLPLSSSTGLVASLEVAPAFLVSFSTAVSHLTSAIVSSSSLCSRVTLAVKFPADADLSLLVMPGGLQRPRARRGPDNGSGGSSSSSPSKLATAPVAYRGRGRGGGHGSSALNFRGRGGGGGSSASFRRNPATAPAQRRYAVADASQRDGQQTRLHVTRRT